ncbi:MAG: DMT family transporter [Fimbriimonadales bacterium]|nr:DMT family transporter [Fimbriimonadales bacterium]
MVCWAFNFVAIKLAYREVSAPAVGFVRTLATYALMVLFVAARREPLGYPRGEAWRFLWMGFVASGAYMVAFLEGMSRTSPAEASILLSTSPLFVMLLSAWAGFERLRSGTLAGAAVAMTGVAMVAAPTAKTPGHLGGNLLILLSSLVWAWGVLLAKPLSEAHSPQRVLMLSLPGALLAIAPYGWSSTVATDWTSLEPLTLWMVGYVAVFAGGLAFTLFYLGVRQVGPTGAMLHQYAVPPGAALLAWWLLGDPLRPLQLVGMVVTFAGLTWALRSRAAPGEGKEP